MATELTAAKAALPVNLGRLSHFKDKLNISLSTTYVAKEAGKSLVDDTVIGKVATMSSYANANVIEIVKVNGTAVDVNSEDKSVDITIPTAYVPKGNATFSELPQTPTASMRGWIYNVTDAFTTDARFKEGAGKSVPAGANVAVIELTAATTEPEVRAATYGYDVLGGLFEFATDDDIDALF